MYKSQTTCYRQCFWAWLLVLIILSLHAPGGNALLSGQRFLKFSGGSQTLQRAPALKSSNKRFSPPVALSGSHWMSPSRCLENLQTSEVEGLTSTECDSRLQIYGHNTLPVPPARSLFSLVLEQFDDKLVQILLSVAALSAVLAGLEKDLHAISEPFIIVVILALNACVGVWQSRSAEDSLDALKKLQPETARVLRDKRWISDLSASELVPGDIIHLRVGDRVPADARIIRLITSTFSTDEGSLTGESATVFKSVAPVEAQSNIAEKTNMVFSGTMVTNGACHAVVTGTGAGTEIGAINAGVQAAKADHQKTPLQKQLDRFGRQLTTLIGGICLFMWCASYPKFSNPVFGSQLKGAVYYAKVAVALGVAAIPEGLPAVITLCLSLGTRRMAKKNVIVRKLSSVETLGSTSVVCTDKTGTLTTNKMTVKAFVTASAAAAVTPATHPAHGVPHSESHKHAHKDSHSVKDSGISLQERAVQGVSYDPRGEIANFTPEMMNSKTMRLFASICTLCNEAQIEYKNGAFDRIGEPTEAALKVLVEKLGAPRVTKSSDPAFMARQFGDVWASQYDVLSILEFNRDRKSMSTLVRPKASGSHSPAATHKVDNLLFVKGACEMVVARCNRIQLEDGTTRPITDVMRAQIMKKFQDLAQRPLRCLALAYKAGEELHALNHVHTPEEAARLPALQNPSGYAHIESDLVLVGICGIKDPARPEAAEAIKKCTEAGIRVMMITGDSKDTAVAIAKDVNIFDDQVDIAKHAFTGREFFALPAETQLDLLRTGNKVFCRAEPKDKQRLISMLEKLDEVVAMTGDGVNDAPALQQAAIGIAMGITGTEVAKGAADMILADDNFATIVNAVEEGRNIYANMQSFICFLISSNIGEVVTIFAATMLGIPEPLTPLHLLWVNLVTDGPPATALGFNPSDPTVMKKHPRPHNEPILSSWLMIRYAITGLYVGAATLGAFAYWYHSKGVSWAQLRSWSSCLDWKDFAHSAEAPHWPQYPCKIFESSLRAVPQTMALSVLVVIELLKALSAVSLDSSLLTVAPWRNPWLLQGVALPMALHLLTVYVKPLSRVFGLAPLRWEDWKVVLICATPILLVEELLKFIGRRVDACKQASLSREKLLKGSSASLF